MLHVALGIIEVVSGSITSAQVAAIDRHSNGLIALSLEEAKAMTGAVQCKMIEALRLTSDSGLLIDSQ